MFIPLRNLIINILSSFIPDRKASHNFREKYKRKSNFRKLKDDLNWIKNEIYKQNNTLSSQASFATQAKISYEINDYLNLTNKHLFLLGQRGRGVSAHQITFIDQFNEKVEDGVYVTVPNKCVCGSDSDELIAVRDRYGIRINTVICKHCGLIRANPYYDKKTLADFYSNEFDEIYRGGIELGFDDYFEKRVAAGEQIIETLKDSSISLNNQTVYEIGCAGGGVLKAFQNLGCNVIGVDYNKNMIESGKEKGLDLRFGSTESLLGCEPADIIILNHVLEHITEPIATLKEMRKILKDSGILFVEVPTIEVISSTYKNNIFSYIQNAHIFYFSLHTLRYILECSGYSCSEVSPNGMIARKSANERGTSDICKNEYEYALEVLGNAERAFWGSFNK